MLPVSPTVSELAALVQGEVRGNGAAEIRGVRSLQEAGPGDLTFCESERFARLLPASRASAVLVPRSLPRDAQSDQVTLILVDDARSAFHQLRAQLLGPARTRWVGVHPLAVVAESAKLGQDVAVHALCVVGESVEIGDRSTLCPGAVIGANCRIGRDVVIHPRVVLYEGVTIGDRVEIHAGAVIGSDGFGYQTKDGRHNKIPQTGGVVIGDDVEIGANSTIDRGMMENTTIGDGTKIDNLVQIGHNCKIGRHNIYCAGVGIGGSTTIGDYVVLAGQVGVKDHITVGSGATIAAQAGLLRDVPAGQTMWGTPAIDARREAKIHAILERIPELFPKLRRMIAEFERESSRDHAASTASPTNGHSHALEATPE